MTKSEAIFQVAAGAATATLEPGKQGELCPLCQKPNGCAFGLDLPASNCWCMDKAPLLPCQREQLEQALLTAGDIDEQCICAQCWQRFQQQGDD